MKPYMFILSYILCGFVTLAYAGSSLHVPANAKNPFRPVTLEQLSMIVPEEALTDSGVVEALVVRPKKDHREAVEAISIDNSTVLSDKHVSSSSEHPELEAVSLMRFDVSAVLGDARIPGDNIHVAGLRIGESYLDSGDILTFTHVGVLEPSVILLKTAVPHYPCRRLLGRSGQIAFDFLSADGEFKEGIWKTDDVDAGVRAGFVHGLKHRLRGVKLAVLKGGDIRLGDRVNLLRGENREKIIDQFGLEKLVNELVKKGEEVGAKYERQKQEIKEMWLRQSYRQ